MKIKYSINKIKSNLMILREEFFLKITKSRIIGSIIFSILSEPALANRLQAAAERGKAEIIPMAQTAAVIGVVVGGFLMSIGASHVGRGILLSALVGAAAIFGGPALIEVVRSIFGS